MGPCRKPRYDSQSVVTRPEVSSNIFSAASREAAKCGPLPRNTARRKSAAAIFARISKLDPISPPVIWLSLSHNFRYPSGLPSMPMKRAASSKLVKLLVMTKLLSRVSAGSVMTCTFSWRRESLARLPCSLQVTTTCRN